MKIADILNTVNCLNDYIDTFEKTTAPKTISLEEQIDIKEFLEDYRNLLLNFTVKLP